MLPAKIPVHIGSWARSRATGLRWQSVLLNRLENSHFSRLKSSYGAGQGGVCNGAGRLGSPLSARRYFLIVVSTAAVIITSSGADARHHRSANRS